MKRKNIHFISHAGIRLENHFFNNFAGYAEAAGIARTIQKRFD